MSSNLNDVIQEANANARQNDACHSTQPSQSVPEANPLSKARDQLKRSTKLYAASGIVEGLNELLVGDFSGIEEELSIAVDDFSERVAHPKSSDLEIAPSSPSFFALAPAE
ncbi:hypothetical protein Lepto7376_3752 [[Leptolyngbya] sp. PCC 7376]|uniref:hypothetical protein n=1 Tax=[Leptolyngbya] sp. PCC 7376 TaxID=111781 RepID=UPI00029F0859|nr:hypothetical protein [[Leptolyngbya] sp. PCC 7376]AFY39926.1 hypothetical protein Lepto7376_3752 [[Leptolyngbya] sp. PCC 7376]